MTITVDALFETAWPLTGNVAKVKVLLTIKELLGTCPGSLRILDVGCVGPQPLDFWSPMLDSPLAARIKLTGVDVAGIERAQAVVSQNAWRNVTLHQCSGYELDTRLDAASFDVVVATQVLEHLARPLVFLQQANHVVVSGGHVVLTLDSAHANPRYGWRVPIQTAKNAAKKALALTGNERYYDLAWYDHEVDQFLAETGFTTLERGYYNLAPVKRLHNHVCPDEQKNRIMALWWALEEEINSQPATQQLSCHLMGTLYYHCQKDPLILS